MKYDTIKDATCAWIEGFNAIPMSVIEKVNEYDIERNGVDSIVEITPPSDEERLYPFPMWGTMWAFSDPVDIEWANGEHLGPHLQEIADCGFRIYESDDFGILLGIDGAGYDFYSNHWIPLYKARGLKWHKEE